MPCPSPTPRLLRQALCTALLAAAGSAQALNFEFSFAPSVPLAAQQVVVAAGASWASLLTDPVTVKISVVGTSAPSGALAEAESVAVELAYRTTRERLLADRRSAADQSAVASLSGGNSVPRLTHRTLDNPAGAGSVQPYVDNSSFSVVLSAANARALGVAFGDSSGPCATTCDALIRFNTAVAFDFDRSDGIAAGQFDFLGVMKHEIGHALGFISGVDALDLFSPPTAGPFNAELFKSTTLDLFRYSSDSAALGVADFTADARSKALSIDGGASLGPAFATGIVHGDGWQAGHWRVGAGLGLMEAQVAPGVMIDIAAPDLLALDVIGWDLAAPVPEPASAALWVAGLLALGGRALRARRRLPRAV